MLSKSQNLNSFMKDISKFDIRVAIAEIIDMLEDKAKAKKIHVQMDY